MTTLRVIRIFALVAIFTLMISSVSLAQEPAASASNDSVSTITKPGSYYDKCYYTYHSNGNGSTYCYLNTNKQWLVTSDDMIEQMFNLSAVTGKVMYFYLASVSTYSSPSYVYLLSW